MAISDPEKFANRAATDSDWTKTACCDIVPFEWVMCEKRKYGELLLAFF